MSWTHGLITQSVRACERISVVVGSNPTQANFLQLLQITLQCWIPYIYASTECSIKRGIHICSRVWITTNWCLRDSAIHACLIFRRSWSALVTLGQELNLKNELSKWAKKTFNTFRLMYDLTTSNYGGEFQRSFRQIFSSDLELENNGINTDISF